MSLLKTTKLVENAMLKYPYTRVNDFELVFRVYEQIKPDVANINFGELMKRYWKYGLPTFESITRARRKIFEKHPELRDEEATEMRLKEQEKYLEYSQM